MALAESGMDGRKGLGAKWAKARAALVVAMPKSSRRHRSREEQWETVSKEMSETGHLAVRTANGAQQTHTLYQAFFVSRSLHVLCFCTG